MRASFACVLATATLLAVPSRAQIVEPAPAPAPSAGSPVPAPPGIALGATGLTLTGTATLSTDYLFRGISQARNRGAMQGSVDLAHESGVYVGAFLSNATFLASPFNDTQQELDLLVGYRASLGPVSLDIGYVGYLYPDQSKPEGTQLNEYHEAVLRASWQATESLKLSGSVAWSPNFFGRSGEGYYLEGGADLAMPFGFTLLGRVGHQWIERNPRFGTPDYLWYGIGLQREVMLGVNVALGWYGTNISRRECVPVAGRAENGQAVCDGRVMLTLSRTF